MIRAFLAFALCAGMAVPAQADWHEASSEHFVVYADDSAKDVQRFAEMLERYHAAMSLITGRSTEPPSPSNRVTIFAVGSDRQIRKLAGGSKTIAGFYIPRAGASRAFVPDIRLRGRNTDFSMIVLLHEYAHHFLISSSRFAMPRWMSEGGAEFFASASFDKDGSMNIGKPAIHRAAELAYARDVPLRELLDHELYEANRGKKYDAFYGRSWLLFHYLRFEESRAGQLNAYWQAIREGQSSLEAAEMAFGDLDELEDELENYSKARKMFNYRLPPERVPIGPVAVREVSEGLGEMLPIIIRSQRGVNKEEAAEVLVDAREVAAEYPGDAGVLAALAEAEYDAGNDAEAISAADRAIAIDPSITNSYVQKGYALFRMAEDADDQEAAYARAMEPFSALNGIENDHPLPLVYYYRSFVYRGAEPNETARHALERAAQLAPFDKSLWLNAAMMQLREGKIAIARSSLEPLANDPHGGGMAVMVQRLIEALEDAPEGVPFDADLSFGDDEYDTPADGDEPGDGASGDVGDDEPVDPPAGDAG